MRDDDGWGGGNDDYDNDYYDDDGTSAKYDSLWPSEITALELYWGK